MSKKKRQTWSVQEKLRIVLAGIQGDVEISESCRREGLNPTQYYGWKKQLTSSAGKVFGKQQRLQTELTPTAFGGIGVHVPHCARLERARAI